MSLDTAGSVARLRGLTRRFQQGFQDAAPFYPNLCTIVPSTGKDEEYGGLGSMPMVREWLGDRQFAKLRGFRFALENKKWETSIAIEKDDIDDDRLGMYEMTLPELGAQAARHPDRLLFELILAGGATACLDGQFFFDTDHAWGDSGTQSNNIEYECVDSDAPTEAELRGAYDAARQAMLGYKKDNGDLFHQPTVGPMGDLLLTVPVALQTKMSAALFKQYVNGGESNIVLDAPQLSASGFFTDPKVFQLWRTGQNLKPFIFQARKPITTGMKGLDDMEFKDVKFMADARYNVGCLAWWAAVQVTLVTASP